MTTIYFNNQTGSDTLASGAGPAIALTGTAAAHTNGIASTTITLTNNPDLTNVLINGTHAIWLATPSGRQLSFITAKDNTLKTLTVADSFTIASGSAVNYAIGGKRSTLMGSSQLFTDNKGWTYVLEFTGTNYTANATLNVSASSCNITGDSATNLTTVEIQHNGNGFLGHGNGGGIHNLINLKAISTSATKTTGAFFQTQNAQVGVYNCILGDATNKLFRGLGTTNTTSGLYMWNTAIIHCLSHGASLGNSTLPSYVNNCLFANNGNSGLEHSGSLISIVHSVFYSNAGYGFRGIQSNNGSKAYHIQDCVFDSNVHAIGDSWGGIGAGMYRLINNIFRNNTGSTFQSAQMIPIGKSLVFGNVYFGNASKYNASSFSNSIISGELDADPQFVNPAAYNFTVTNPAVIGKSYRQTDPVVPLSSFYNYGTAGAAQPQATGGGGVFDPLNHPLIN